MRAQIALTIIGVCPYKYEKDFAKSYSIVCIAPTAPLVVLLESILGAYEWTGIELGDF